MLRMIDRHAVQQMLTAGVRIGEVSRHFEVSRRTIERIRKEPAVEGAEDAVARWKRVAGHQGQPRTVSVSQLNKPSSHGRRTQRHDVNNTRTDP